MRAVSLLGLSDLRAMVAAPDKYVLLVAGPCNACGALKTEAIEPLLVQPSLNLWTHMVMDVETAEQLTEKFPDGGAIADSAESPLEQETAEKHRIRRRGQAARKKRSKKDKPR